MDISPETAGQSPVITRPEDGELLERLKRKREEYARRIGDEFTHPEQAVVLGLAAGKLGPLDAYIKHKLLSEVLEEGTVETWSFSKKIVEDPIIVSISEYALPQALEITESACGIINAYCSNNLSAVVGGTGLH